MKNVEAIINPYALETITKLLIQRGCDDIVVSEVHGSHRGPGPTLCYRGTEYVGDPASARVETVVQDDQAMTIVAAILHVSQKSSDGGCQVTVCPLEQVISIGVSRVLPQEQFTLKHREQPAKTRVVDPSFWETMGALTGSH
jgi:nitrogen regulatory protein PII